MKRFKKVILGALVVAGFAVSPYSAKAASLLEYTLLNSLTAILSIGADKAKGFDLQRCSNATFQKAALINSVEAARRAFYIDYLIVRKCYNDNKANAATGATLIDVATQFCPVDLASYNASGNVYKAMSDVPAAVTTLETAACPTAG